ncbi:hypothetical protein [Aureimonas ureilytica]|uniref:Uncharacterized protein n=2 Tax=Aureimonas ureilytica TaxID=401562 RepID=A0A175R7J7_9HYPH|nr:hypothetical protein [Aureimonas ureilytica]KTQ95452.1 hypothetical protein NS226_11360 [Aureimonas ureilytica]
MSAMEDSLRRALEGGDARDPAFRESIYAASERALERMLEARGAEEGIAHEQRSRLAETINRVEADFAPQSFAPQSYSAEPHPDEHEPEPYEERLTDEAHPHAAPDGDERDERGEDGGWTPGRPRASDEKTRALPSWKVPALAALLALGLGLLAYAITGALRGRDTPEVTGSTEAVDTLPKLAWIDVFDGNDLERLSTPAGGRIEAVKKDSAREAVRISAPAGSPNEALLAVGPGTLHQIAGRNVRIEIVAGSPDGTPREFSVRCLVGSRSFCDSQRFTTDMPEEAFVFDVTVPAVASNDTSIAIAPGVAGQTNDVDIYSLRLRQLG